MVQHSAIDHSGLSGIAAFGSNSNAVSQANAPGASGSNARADHVHMGVRSIAHSSNTFTGPVILTASGVLGITSPTPGTINLSAVDVTGSGGGGVTVQDEGTPLATTGTTLNFVGSGVTASGTGATKTITIAGGSVVTQIASYTGVGHSAGYVTPLVETLGTGTLNAKVSLNQTGSAVFVNLFKNGARVQQQTSSAGTNTYTFTGESCATGDQWYVATSNGGSVVPLKLADAFDCSAGLRVLGTPSGTIHAVV